MPNGRMDTRGMRTFRLVSVLSVHPLFRFDVLDEAAFKVPLLTL
jgi:hypothetical protein